MTPSTPAPDIIQKRMEEFRQAEDRARKNVGELQSLRAEIDQRITRANAEVMLNAAARQTCEALLKDLAPSAPEATPDGQEAEQS